MDLLPDWMYHAIEESFTCQFVSVTANGVPVALPLFLNHFDPDAGTLIFSSPVVVKRLENVRRHPQVAVLFSPAGTGKEESPHVLLVQGRAEVDDSDPLSVQVDMLAKVDIAKTAFPQQTDHAIIPKALSYTVAHLWSSPCIADE